MLDLPCTGYLDDHSTPDKDMSAERKKITYIIVRTFGLDQWGDSVFKLPHYVRFVADAKRADGKQSSPS